MTAPKLIGAASTLLASILITSGPAFAYHGEANHGSVAWGAILPIVAVVVIGVILLSIWKPQSRNAKARKRDRSPGQRAAHTKKKRAR